MYEGTWMIEPCEREPVAELARELAVSAPTAPVLGRRGYGDGERARAFLDGGLPGHDPFALGDMVAACEAIRAAVAEGRRICVPGASARAGIGPTALPS